MQEALIIYAFPLYVESVPAKLKAFLDRQFVTIMPSFESFHNITRHPLWHPKEQYMSIFSICGFPEIGQFEPLNDTFKAIARNSHKPLIASIFRPGAESFTAPPYRLYLEKILTSLEQAGRNLVELGEVPKMTLKCISSDYGVSKEKWLTYSNLHWGLKRN